MHWFDNYNVIIAKTYSRLIRQVLQSYSFIFADTIRTSATHPHNNDNKNSNNDVQSSPTKCENDSSESEEEDGNVMLLNDYRIAKLRKEEVIEFNFSGATKTTPIVKRNSSKGGDAPIIQNLRQMYRKPARSPMPVSDQVIVVPVTNNSNNNNVSIQISKILF